CRLHISSALRARGRPVCDRATTTRDDLCWAPLRLPFPRDPESVGRAKRAARARVMTNGGHGASAPLPALRATRPAASGYQLSVDKGIPDASFAQNLSRKSPSSGFLNKPY